MCDPGRDEDEDDPDYLDEPNNTNNDQKTLGKRRCKKNVNDLIDKKKNKIGDITMECKGMKIRERKEGGWTWRDNIGEQIQENRDLAIMWDLYAGS